MLRYAFTRAGPRRRRLGLVLVEYGILLALLVVAAIGVFAGLGSSAHKRVVQYGDAVADCRDTRPATR